MTLLWLFFSVCYPGNRLDVNRGDFRVEEVDAKITTSMIPDSLVEDIYGGDDRVFEFIIPDGIVKVCT